MVVIIAIAVILLLLLVVPAVSPGPTRDWSGFVAGASATDRDEVRGSGELRVF